MFPPPYHPLKKVEQWKHRLFNIRECNRRTVTKLKLNMIKVLAFASGSNRERLG